ncbi:MAG: ABC transporter permease [Solirubrobacteraceae bacterium]
MSHGTYLRLELLRTLRNRRFLVFSLIFPVVLYLLIVGTNNNEEDVGGTGLSMALYFMVSISSFGTMTAMLSSGARIASERKAGWNRQLRLTPLTPYEYIRAKLVTGYAVALMSILVLYAAGIVMGVSLPINRWLEMTGLILVGLIPFAALGIAIGHLLSEDSMGPAVGGTTAILAFVSGTWFPVPEHGFLHDLSQALPSSYLVQAGRVGVGGSAWGTTGWLVVAAWTVVLGAVARWAYLRDTGRA